MNRKLIVSLALTSLVTTLTSCSSSFTHKIDFNPVQSLRVAILPFVFIDDDGTIQKEHRNDLLIDKVSLISSVSKRLPTEILRNHAHKELLNSALDILPANLVYIELPHHGFARDDGSIDMTTLYAASPKEICQHALDCDAVLYGRVEKWNRDYYGLESVNTIALELELVSAQNGKTLFLSRGEDYVSSGLSNGPTGYSSLALEPIKGLDSERIESLASSVIKETLKPLTIGNSHDNSEPPPSILASSVTPASKDISRDKPLVVLAFGTADSTAQFSIGKTITNVPMEERSPGHYFGEYIALPSDTFDAANVKVTLVDAYGRSTTKIVKLGPFSLKR